jgi:hypothetical protein
MYDSVFELKGYPHIVLVPGGISRLMQATRIRRSIINMMAQGQLKDWRSGPIKRLKIRRDSLFPESSPTKLGRSTVSALRNLFALWCFSLISATLPPRRGQSTYR